MSGAATDYRPETGPVSDHSTEETSVSGTGTTYATVSSESAPVRSSTQCCIYHNAHNGSCIGIPF